MSVRETIIANAKSDIGISESPKGSNKVKYNDWMYPEGHLYFKDSKPWAWCGSFVSYVYHFSNCPLPAIDKGVDSGFYYVPTMYNWAFKNKKLTDQPRPGDIFIIDFNGDGKWDHTGIFVDWVGASSFRAIEGNTSPTTAGSQDNGGSVAERVRKYTTSTVKFINVID